MKLHRRSFFTLLGTSAAAWPLAARAQQRPAMPVIGYLYPGVPEASGAQQAAAFRKGLGESGYVEGRNVLIEYRWGQNDSARLPELAADLVRRRVSVIVTPGSGIAGRAARAATSTIPIVFGMGGDPVQLGLVASLNRPGGNVTGFASMALEIGAKQLGLLHELLPRAARFAVLVNPASPATPSVLKDVQAATAAIGGQVESFGVSTNDEIDAAFASTVGKQVDALLVGPGPLFGNRRAQIVSLAMYHRVPALYGQRDAVEIGGRMSYGSSVVEMARQVGIYAARILKGEKPADLPVQLPIKFELVINLHTAKLLGIKVPPTLLATADEVIE